jgi:hypothetical protein
MQQMHLVRLKQEGRLFIVQHFCIALKRCCAKRYEVHIVVEENGCLGLLIICIVTWVEDFNARLCGWIGMFGSDSIARGSCAEVYSQNMGEAAIFL